MKVKSLSIFSVLLIFLFALGTTAEVQAQEIECACLDEKLNSSPLKLCDGLSIGLERPPSNCPGDEIAVVFENNCSEKYIPISVYSVNLDDRIEGGRNSEELDWPDKLAPLYLEYSYDNSPSNISSQAITWTPIGTVTSVEGQSFTIYESIIMIPLAGLIDAECPPDSEEQFNFSEPLHVDIVTSNSPSKGKWEPYPFDKYDYKEGIFSCEFFPNLCSETGKTGRAYNICLDCGDCIPYTSQGEGRMASNADTDLLNISPNPFTDFLQYKYTSKTEEQITVHLISVDGSLVLQEIKKVGIGENSFLLDTSHLPQGLYFMQISSGSNRILQGLTKMD